MTKLPASHVCALLAEAARLHHDALHRIECGALNEGAKLFADARLLAEDAASYALPSGMNLSVAATLSTLNQQIDSIEERRRSGQTRT